MQEAKCLTLEQASIRWKTLTLALCKALPSRGDNKIRHFAEWFSGQWVYQAQSYPAASLNQWLASGCRNRHQFAPIR